MKKYSKIGVNRNYAILGLISFVAMAILMACVGDGETGGMNPPNGASA